MIKEDFDKAFEAFIGENCVNCPLDDLCKHLIRFNKGTVCNKLLKIKDKEIYFQFEE